MLLYEILHGGLWDMADTGAFAIGAGYSGHGLHKNDPTAVRIFQEGPLPPGAYRIEKPYTHPTLGPLTFNLTPLAGIFFGRSEFRIHGDAAAHPGEASHGCIVQDLPTRQEIADDFVEDLLIVVPVLPS